MAGSTHTSTVGSKLAGMAIQTSLLGQPIPLGWGRGRLSCNLIDFVAFTAIPHTTTTKTGGKGGSSTTSNTTYTYTASIELGICEGPIIGIVTVYKDSATLPSLAAAGLSIALGSSSQTAWPYLSSLFPTHALAYRTLAYAYAQGYDLGDTATVANHGFEVDFAIQLGGGVVDADPKDILTDFFTNADHGVTGFTSALLGDWSDYSLYARAANLLLSPVIDQQVQASQFVSQVLQETNSDCVWSEGVLKIKPYGDASVTANGVTWNPNLTPVFDLTEDDFLSEVVLEIVDQSDAYNRVQVEYLDRANQYNAAITVAEDLDNIVTLGLRQQDVTQFHDICDGQIARTATQLWLQRTLYIRDLYHFDLPMDFIGLEPHIDYLTLTTTVDGMLLNRQLVQIVSIDEDEDGADVLHLTAEGVPGHTASAALYAAHHVTGFTPDIEADPGNVSNPILFNAPASMASGYEIWCAAAGLNANWGGANVWVSFDNVNYSQIGTLAAPATYGHLNSTLSSHSDPDTVNTVGVDLTDSNGVLNSVSTAQADAGVSLAMVGTPPFGEIIAYSHTSLISAHVYQLDTYIRRGQRSTVIETSLSFNQFVRLDDAIFRIPFPVENVGGTMYVKFQSFNFFGRGLQDLSGLTAHSISLALNQSLPGLATGLGLALGGSTWTGNRIDMVCDSIARADSYSFEFYKSDGVTLVRTVVSGSPVVAYTAEMAALDSVGALREYKVKVRGKNAAGFGPYSTLVDITNAAPAALSSPSATGGTITGTVTATASSDPDLGGYIVFWSPTTGFNPATAGNLVQSGINTVTINGLPAGTYFCRIAAYDAWTGNPALLNLSAELSFTITTGGGGAPTGTGGGGGSATGSGGGGFGGGHVFPV